MKDLTDDQKSLLKEIEKNHGTQDIRPKVVLDAAKAKGMKYPHWFFRLATMVKRGHWKFTPVE